jgi:hypothetical protein
MKRPDTICVPRTTVAHAVTVKGPGLGLVAMVALAVIVGATGAAKAAGTDAKPSPAAQLFLEAMEDVPLMTGLAERPGAGVVFETAAGRIVEAEAVSRPAANLTVDRIMAFYGTTLVALGWRSVGQGRFAREGEILNITTAAADKGLRVRFSLRPK